MNADKRRLELDGSSRRVIGCTYDVADGLGAGFLEKVYENALAHEIRKMRLQVRQQHCVQVKYDGVIVGDFAADLLVQDCVLVELKACKAFDDIHAAQCMNYLRATGLSVCLLINSGSPKVQIKRIVHRY